jgi:hypothetical protein
MHGTTDEWRAARRALLDELSRLRHQFSLGDPVERSEIHAPRTGIDTARRSAMTPAAMGFASVRPVLRWGVGN